MLRQKTQQLATGAANNKEGLIEAGLPKGYDIRRVHRAIYPDGVEVFSYNGKEFLEIHPLQLETIREDHTTRIKATWNYRYLNGDQPLIQENTLART